MDKMLMVLSLLVYFPFIFSYSNLCLLNDGDLIKDCSCRHDNSGAHMIYNLNLSLNKSDDFTFTSSYPSLRDVRNCSYNGAEVVCYMPVSRGPFPQMKFSVRKGNTVLDNTTILLNIPLKNCWCDWSKLEPLFQKVKFALNSKKILKFAWRYLSQKEPGEQEFISNAEQKLRIISNVCIKETGHADCKVKLCQQEYYNGPDHSCERVHINELDYNKRYDFCIRSKVRSQCRNKVHDKCFHNQTLDAFYYDRFRVNDVNCSVFPQTNEVRLQWNTYDSGNPSRVKHGFKYALYNKDNELVLDDKTDGRRIERNVNNAQNIIYARIRLCLERSCYSHPTQTICSIYYRETSEQNSLVYLIPGTIASVGILIVVVFIHFRNRISVPDEVIIPAEQINIFKQSHSDSDISINTLAVYAEVLEEKHEEYDTLDLSHVT